MLLFGGVGPILGLSERGSDRSIAGASFAGGAVYGSSAAPAVEADARYKLLRLISGAGNSRLHSLAKAGVIESVKA